MTAEELNLCLRFSESLWECDGERERLRRKEVTYMPTYVYTGVAEPRGLDVERHALIYLSDFQKVNSL